jgi:hypothetical protein
MAQERNVCMQSYINERIYLQFSRAGSHSEQVLGSRCRKMGAGLFVLITFGSPDEASERSERADDLVKPMVR